MTATAAFQHSQAEETAAQPARRGRAHDVAIIFTIAVIQLVWFALLGYALWAVS